MFGKLTYVQEEPGDFVTKYLIPSEQVIFATRIHWIRVILPVLAAFGSVVLFLVAVILLPPNVRAATYLLVPVMIGAFGWAAWRLWDWANDWFLATNKRIMRLTGYFIRKSKMMPISKVTDLQYERSPWGEVFNYGKFIFESAGQDQALTNIEFVPRSHDLYYELCEQLFGDDKTYRERHQRRTVSTFLGGVWDSFMRLFGKGKKEKHFAKQDVAAHAEMAKAAEDDVDDVFVDSDEFGEPDVKLRNTSEIPTIPRRRSSAIERIKSRGRRPHSPHWQDTNSHEFPRFDTFPGYDAPRVDDGAVEEYDSFTDERFDHADERDRY